MNDTQIKIEDLKNTVSDFSDWLDHNSDGYIMLVNKDDKAILVVNGSSDNLVKALACGMMRDERLQDIILKVANYFKGSQKNSVMRLVDKLIDKLK